MFVFVLIVSGILEGRPQVETFPFATKIIETNFEIIETNFEIIETNFQLYYYYFREVSKCVLGESFFTCYLERQTYRKVECEVST